jgi:N6-adenosine-specific RNA methylase IME4
MTLKDICALAHGDQIAGFDIERVGAFLFLWATNSFILSGDAVEVCRSWGFVPKQLVTWIKTRKGRWARRAEAVADAGDGLRGSRTQDEYDGVARSVREDGLAIGLGHITRGITEQLIVATRGRYSELVLNRSERNVIFAPRRSHSRKPDQQYDLIERLVPGPYLELFATQRRDGWTSWGKPFVARTSAPQSF